MEFVFLRKENRERFDKHLDPLEELVVEMGIRMDPKLVKISHNLVANQALKKQEQNKKSNMSWNFVTCLISRLGACQWIRNFNSLSPKNGGYFGPQPFQLVIKKLT